MNTHIGKRISQALCGLGILVCYCAVAVATPRTIWQIGKFDQSSLEFKTGSAPQPAAGAGQPKMDVLYIPGKSKPETDWQAFQPGTANGKAGFRAHPYAVQFDLPEAPRGVFTLKVSLLFENPRTSRLEVEVNGRQGLFYPHPKLNYAGGDYSDAWLATYSADTLTVDIPAAFLKKGTNELVLTAVDEPAERDDVVESGLYYDALELDQDAAAKSSEIKADVTPTIFYTQKNGQLVELVDVFVRSSSALKSGQVVLTMGKEQASGKLLAGRDFGEQLVELEVPEFSPGAKGVLAVATGGRSRRFPVQLEPAKKWNVFMVPHTHLDIGYTDYQAKVAELQSRTIDEAIQMIHDHPDFRFSLDGYWGVEKFMAGRSEEEKRQLLELVKDKKIFVPAQHSNFLTGFSSLEASIRSFYPSFKFAQKNGGDTNYANITDVPSYSWSYASVLAAAGIKYFAAGSNNYRAPVLLQGRMHEKSPFWWEGPDGGKVLMWYTRQYQQIACVFGMPPQMPAGRDSLPLFLQAYSRPGYKSDAVMLYGSQIENADLFPQLASFAGEWNRVYAFPRLKYSGIAEAMAYITGQIGDALPVVRGDGGPLWEDGVASTARGAAIERETEQRALAAEKFSTISSLINPRHRPDAGALGRLWDNIRMFNEHSWGAGGSISDPKSQESVRQLELKESFAPAAKREADYVLQRSLASLADYIYDPKGTLLVFNPLSWVRSSLVEADLGKGLEIVDLASDHAVSYEELSTGKNYRHVRFLAEGVPSVGYKAFALRETKASPPAPQHVATETLENAYYRVVLDPAAGAVKSIFDKELNKELVSSSSPYRFNQYLYVTGADQLPNRMIRYSTVVPLAQLTIHKAGGGKLLSVTHQPFGAVARLESSGVNTPRIETEVILFDGQKKIEFINRVCKTEVLTKEGVYFAFPLDLGHPRFRYEIQNGFVDPARDLIPGAGKEWFPVQGWVAADEDGITAALVPLDAPMVTLGDIARGNWPEEFGRRPGTIFSYVMNNYWPTNYAAAQGGEFTFRYVLTSGRDLQPASLSRLGREEMSPLETDEITWLDKFANTPRPLASAQSSFLRVSQPDVVLVTWKTAEDGDGMVMRFLDVAGKENTVEVETPLVDVKSAWMSDALERKQGALQAFPHGFTFSIKPFQIVTVRLEGKGNLK